MGRGPSLDPVRESRQVSERGRHVGGHRIRTVRAFPIQEEGHDAHGGSRFEVVEAVIHQDTVCGGRSDEPRNVGPIRRPALVRMLGVATEDPVDEAVEAGPPEEPLRSSRSLPWRRILGVPSREAARWRIARPDTARSRRPKPPVRVLLRVRADPRASRRCPRVRTSRADAVHRAHRRHLHNRGFPSPPHSPGACRSRRPRRAPVAKNRANLRSVQPGDPRAGPGIRGTSSRDRGGRRRGPAGRASPHRRSWGLRLSFAEEAGISRTPMSRPMQPPWPSTFSIVSFDPKTKDLGVAVESKFVAVGAVVPFARAGVGAVATQSYANTTYGPKALTMLKQDVAPKDV